MSVNTFQRPLVDDLVRLLTDELPPRIVAVTGPRQSGKTTLVRQALRRLHASGLSGRHIGVDDPQAGLGAPFSGSETTTVPIDPRFRNGRVARRRLGLGPGPGMAARTRVRAGARRDPVRGGLVGCGEGAVGPRPRDRVPAQGDHPGIRALEPAHGKGRESGRTLHAARCASLAAAGNGNRLRFNAQRVSVLRRLSGGPRR